MGLRLSAISPRSVLFGLAIVLAPATCALSQIPSWTNLSPTPVDSQYPGEFGIQFEFNGNYGTEYQFNAANYPGAREGSVSFTDLQGRLWLFGGYGYDSTQDRGDLNDLWVFDPTQGTQGEWAWMGGSSTLGTPCSTEGFAAGLPVTCNGQLGSYVTEYQFDPANSPGGRQSAASWVDPQGRLWLYGGVGFDSVDNYQNDLDDLWVFDPSQGTYGEWAWMGGSNTGGQSGTYGTEFQFNAANIPGDREGAVTWTVNGKFWLFGGQLGPDTFNDLWVFDPSQGANGEWAWMGGSNTVQPLLVNFGSGNILVGNGVPGTYGTEYKYGPTYAPGSRFGASSWTDSKGRLWLFGGAPYYDSLENGELNADFNDLWVFDPAEGANGEWAWMGGSQSACVNCDNQAVAGTEYQFGPTNLPGQRDSAVSWTDKSGRFWLADGESWGFFNEGSQYPYDLWVFDPTQGQHGEWAWMGSSPSYGAYSPATWTDPDGSFWLFGGVYGAFPDYARGPQTLLPTEFSDFWQLQVPSNQVPTPTFSPAPGTYAAPQSVAINDAFSAATIYYTTDGTSPSTSSAVYQNPITVSAKTTIKALAVYGGTFKNSTASAAYTFKVPAPVFGLAAGTFSSPQAVNISVTIADETNSPIAVIWYTTDGTTPVPGQGTAVQYALGSPVPINQTTVLKAVGTSPGWTTSSVTSATYTLKVPEPAFALPMGTYSTPQSAAISDSNSNAVIWYTTDGTTPVPGQGTAVQYTGTPVSITQTTMLKAVGAISGWATSSPASANYTFKVPTPTFGLRSGTYSAAQSATIGDSDLGATIWYTTDGTTPIPGEGTAVEYNGTAVAINATTDLKVVAAESGWSNSSMASATYTIR